MKDHKLAVAVVILAVLPPFAIYSLCALSPLSFLNAAFQKMFILKQQATGLEKKCIYSTYSPLSSTHMTSFYYYYLFGL
jgi:hypothetical protein